MVAFDNTCFFANIALFFIFMRARFRTCLIYRILSTLSCLGGAGVRRGTRRRCTHARSQMRGCVKTNIGSYGFILAAPADQLRHDYIELPQ